MQPRLEQDAGLKAWSELAVLYRGQKPEEFNAAVAKAREMADTVLTPRERTRISVETVYNRIAPFFWTTGLYVFGLVLSIFAVLRAPWARTSAVRVLCLYLQPSHVLAIFARIYTAGPAAGHEPVFLRRLYWLRVRRPRTLFRTRLQGRVRPLQAGSVLGCPQPASVAHNLELMEKKDQMEMMQAVLDTNFWLATHVVCITLGYVATAFAGILGVVYVVQAVFFPTFDRDRERTLSTLIYVVLCVAQRLLSFVGTVLGGIWADQSWGRFWGWDPKENGAVLIVLWNVLVLHARWAGLVKSRGRSHPCCPWHCRGHVELVRNQSTREGPARLRVQQRTGDVVYLRLGHSSGVHRRRPRPEADVGEYQAGCRLSRRGLPAHPGLPEGPKPFQPFQIPLRLEGSRQPFNPSMVTQV